MATGDIRTTKRDGKWVNTAEGNTRATNSGSTKKALRLGSCPEPVGEFRLRGQGVGESFKLAGATAVGGSA